MVANLQRSDLGPIEEGKAFAKLMNVYHLSANLLALKLGINIGRVYIGLKRLELEPEIQVLMEERKISKDQRVVEALLDISDKEARIKLAEELGNRNASIKASVEAARRVSEYLQSAKIKLSDAPAVRFSQHREILNRPAWDALVQIGKLPPWLLMEISAKETCDDCALRSVASASTCKNCPLVDLLR